jgi:hypothetical protein
MVRLVGDCLWGALGTKRRSVLRAKSALHGSSLIPFFLQSQLPDLSTAYIGLDLNMPIWIMLLSPETESL